MQPWASMLYGGFGGFLLLLHRNPALQSELCCVLPSRSLLFLPAFGSVLLDPRSPSQALVTEPGREEEATPELLLHSSCYLGWRCSPGVQQWQLRKAEGWLSVLETRLTLAFTAPVSPLLRLGWAGGKRGCSRNYSLTLGYLKDKEGFCVPFPLALEKLPLPRCLGRGGSPRRK